MGTRSVVAVPTAGGGWKGRYVHWDGYPAGVGDAVRAIVERDGVETAVDTLVVTNYGWSSVAAETREDEDLSAGMSDGRFKVVPGYGVAYTEQDGQSSPDAFITDEPLEPLLAQHDRKHLGQRPGRTVFQHVENLSPVPAIGDAGAWRTSGAGRRDHGGRDDRLVDPDGPRPCPG